jgi:hypothetical protein
MINDISELEVGQRVYYQPSHYQNHEWENGVIKEIRDTCETGVWVVYNCNNDWKHYVEYTSALTNLQDLFLGWKH